MSQILLRLDHNIFRATVPRGYSVPAETTDGMIVTSLLVDGQRVDVWRANYAFRAVALDAGEHKVSFEYRPVSFTAGLACSGLALAAMVAAWIWLGWQSRQHTKLSR